MITATIPSRQVSMWEVGEGPPFAHETSSFRQLCVYVYTYIYIYIERERDRYRYRYRYRYGYIYI